MHKLPASTNKSDFNMFCYREAFCVFRLLLGHFVTVNFSCVAEYYAVMPPLERFMEVPREDRREFFFRDIERGDIVIGKITSIREFGFFMVLICLGSGIIREISDLEITVRYSLNRYFVRDE